MFENILITYSERISNNHVKIIEKVRKLLGKRESLVVKARDLQESCFNDIDLVLTIGGDGTFIKAASFLGDSLILGINAEPEFSEGALTNITEKEIYLLENILKGNYRTTQRQRARLKRNSILLKELALNEVFVGAESQFHTSRYVIKFRGKKEEQRSSGVIIATGSGSSAWYKAAGGKPFRYDERKLEFLVREPYYGRIFKPEILKGEILPRENIMLESKRSFGGVIAVDANAIYHFNNPDYVEIELSNQPLNVMGKP